MLHSWPCGLICFKNFKTRRSDAIFYVRNTIAPGMIFHSFAQSQQITDKKSSAVSRVSLRGAWSRPGRRQGASPLPRYSLAVRAGRGTLKHSPDRGQCLGILRLSRSFRGITGPCPLFHGLLDSQSTRRQKSEKHKQIVQKCQNAPGSWERIGAICHSGKYTNYTNFYAEG